MSVAVPARGADAAGAAAAPGALDGGGWRGAGRYGTKSGADAAVMRASRALRRGASHRLMRR
jgi:hypothetical protein